MMIKRRDLKDYELTGLAASIIKQLPKQTTVSHLTQINKTLKKQNNPNNFKVSGHKNGLAFNTLRYHKCDLTMNNYVIIKQFITWSKLVDTTNLTPDCSEGHAPNPSLPPHEQTVQGHHLHYGLTVGHIQVAPSQTEMESLCLLSQFVEHSFSDLLSTVENVRLV